MDFRLYFNQLFAEYYIDEDHNSACVRWITQHFSEGDPQGIGTPRARDVMERNYRADARFPLSYLNEGFSAVGVLDEFDLGNPVYGVEDIFLDKDQLQEKYRGFTDAEFEIATDGSIDHAGFLFDKNSINHFCITQYSTTWPIVLARLNNLNQYWIDYISHFEEDF